MKQVFVSREDNINMYMGYVVSKEQRSVAAVITRRLRVCGKRVHGSQPSKHQKEERPDEEKKKKT